MQLSIQITGVPVAQKNLEKLGIELVTGMKPALTEIGDLGSKYFGGVAFKTRGAAFGMPWEPLAKSTDIFKSKHWPGRPDMVRTGELQESFGYRVNGNDSVYLSNSAPWFVYHQSTEDRHKLPRRVMIGVNSSIKSMITRVIKQNVSTIIQRTMT